MPPTMRWFFKKLRQKVVVFFMPSRIVYERSAAEERKSLRTRTEEELSLRAQDLREICTLLDELSVPYYLSGGALLGSIRDGDFVPWDGDVDIDVRVEDVYPKQARLIGAFARAGYEIKLHTPSKIDFKIKMTKHKTLFEIVGFFKMGDMRYRKWSHYPDSFTHGNTEVLLRGERYKTFANPEQYLEWYYGDWRTPVRAASHHAYVTNSSRTRPLVLIRLRLASLFARF